MSLKFIETDIPGVMIIEPAVFNDDRGYFLETYHYNKYSEKGLDITFVQDNHSHSVRGTLRGLHYQLNHAQGKLMYAVKGEIFDVAVDIRKGSPDFGKWTGVILSNKNKRQFYIPPGFAHGFCVLSDEADIIYKCTDFYAPDDEYGIIWDDPEINIDWPITDPNLSYKDSKFDSLSEISNNLLPVYDDSK